MTDPVCVCLKCGKIADEINISVNVSLVDRETGDWIGDTDMGDCSERIGSYCDKCGSTYEKDAIDVILKHIGSDIEMTIPPRSELLGAGRCVKCGKHLYWAGSLLVTKLGWGDPCTDGEDKHRLW